MSEQPGREARSAARRWAATTVALVVTTAALIGTLGVSAAPAETTSRASLTDIENDVMCVACHESLAVAQSPEAYSERQYIRDLIAQGQTKQQIENQLVSQYGPAVLGKPPADGFNLLVYVIPPLVVALGIALLLFTIPKWRRRARTAAASQPEPAPALDPDDARRLDDDLARQA